jgi:hypothetical protein
MDKERVVDRINKENRELYGDTCSKCSMYYHYCRCEHVEQLKKDELGLHFGRLVNPPPYRPSLYRVLDRVYGFFYFGLWDLWYKVKRFINKLFLSIAYITRDDTTRNRYE